MIEDPFAPDAADQTLEQMKEEALSALASGNPLDELLTPPTGIPDDEPF